MRDRPGSKRGARNRPIPFAKAGRRETPQKQGRREETAIAKDMGGTVQPGSGCFAGKGGDVLTDRFLVESKRTGYGSFSITTALLEKITSEAFLMRRKPAMVVTMLNLTNSTTPDKWALVPYQVLKQLLDGDL